VAYAGVRDPNHHLAFAGRSHINIENLKRLPRGKRNSGAGFHEWLLRSGTGLSGRCALAIELLEIVVEPCARGLRKRPKPHHSAPKKVVRLRTIADEALPTIASGYGSMTINH
jgi:hypothetical protein